MTGLIKQYLISNKSLYKAIKNIFGFYPTHISLYELAFRHKSATEKKINGLKLNNERLEYLGDAILSAIVADLLFKRFPYKSEGFLTQMRSKIVSRSSLNQLSNKLGLNKLIYSSSELSPANRSAPGDTFEAVIAAMYLDKGYDFTSRVLVNRIINIHFDLDKLETTEVNFKSRVLEWSQKNKHEIIFKVIDEIGEKQNKQYLVAVVIDGKNISQAQDYTIKGAEKLASEKAWQQLQD